MRLSSVVASALAVAASANHVLDCAVVTIEDGSCANSVFRSNIGSGAQPGGTTFMWHSTHNAIRFDDASAGYTAVMYDRSSTHCDDRNLTVSLTMTHNDDELTCNLNLVNVDEDKPSIVFDDAVAPVAYVEAEVTDIPTAAAISATDDCDTTATVVYHEQKSATMFQVSSAQALYSLTRTWTATDHCGNTDSFTQEIDVIDSTDPVFDNVPSDLTMDCVHDAPTCDITCTDSNEAIDPVIEFSTTRIDNCEHAFTIINQWTCTDGGANSVEHVQTLTIQDVAAPTFAGNQADGTVDCNAVPEPAQVSVSDNCDISPTLEYSQSVSSSNSATYTIVRKWDTSDACGNTDSVSRTIQVEDTTAPVLSIEADATSECKEHDPMPCASAVHDDCDDNPSLSMHESKVQLTCDDEYLIIHTYTVSDSSANTDVQSRTITVTDEDLPVLVGVPADTTVDCVPTAWPTVTATDCSATKTVTNTSSLLDDDLYNYRIKRVWTATDACGNTAQEVQTMTVQDNVSPAFDNVGPASNVTVTCDNVPTAPAMPINDNCEDNCAPEVTLTETTQPGNCDHEYVISRVWTATDCAGEQSTHNQLVTVNAKAPTLGALPIDMSIDYTDSLPEKAPVTLTNYCGDYSLDYDTYTVQGSCDNTYDVIRTWSVDDGCGAVYDNPSHTQTITVTDTAAPTIDDPADRANTCVYSEVPWSVTARDEDGVSVVVYETCTDNSGSCDDVGSKTCIFTATDACGNTATSNATETWDDTEAPVLVCADHASTVSDNCDDSLVVPVYNTWNTPVPYSATNGCLMSVTSERWTGTDRCGNVGNTCSLDTNNYDVTDPVFTAPDDEYYQCRSDPNPAQPNLTATDNFTPGDIPVTVTDNIDYHTDQCGRTIYRSFMAQDDCGNDDSQQQTITFVEPTAGAVTVCQEGYDDKDCTLPVDEVLECPTAPSPVDLYLTTVCGTEATLEPRLSATISSTLGAQAFEYTWEWTDNCHTFSHVVTIQVTDTQAPVYQYGGDDATDECEVPTTDPVTAIDACGAHTCSIVDQEGVPDAMTAHCYTQINHWECTDYMGHTSTHTQTLIAYDETPPTISAPPADETVDCTYSGAPTLQATDNCEAGFLAVTLTSSTFAASGTGNTNTGVWTNVWDISDNCGNPSSHTQNVVVQDLQAPVITVNNTDYTESCVLSAQATATVTDNCDDPAPTIITDVTTTDGDCDYRSVNVYTWSATDLEGHNTLLAQTVTVIDDSDPTADISGVQDETVEWGSDIDLTDPAKDITIADNCVTPSINCTVVLATGTCSIDHVWSCVVTDDCGNAIPLTNIKTVTEYDDYQVSLSPKPADVTYQCTDTIPAPEVVWDVSGQNISLTTTAFESSRVGADDCSFFTRTWHVSHCFHSDTHVQTITVQDLVDPVITVGSSNLHEECVVPTFPANTYSASDQCSGSVPVTLTTVAMDITPADATYDLLQQYTFTFTTEDNCGLTDTEVVQITYGDTTDPYFGRVGTDTTIQAPATPTFVIPTAYDNCVVTQSQTTMTVQGTCPFDYTVTRTYIAVDGNGNTDSVSDTVKSEDTTPPQLYRTDGLTLPADHLNLDHELYLNGYADAPEIKANDTAAGHLGVITPSEVFIDGTGLNNFTLIRTWDVEDTCGNSNSHVQTIIVISPEACQPPDLTVECSELDTILTMDDYATNCSDHLYDDVSVTFTDKIVMDSSTCENDYLIVRTYVISELTAVDSNGPDSITLDQTVTVQDTSVPVFTYGEVDTTDTTDLTKDQCYPKDPPTKTAADNCGGGVTVTFTTDKDDVNFIYTTTYTAVDACGNTATTTHVESGNDIRGDSGAWTDQDGIVDIEYECETTTPWSNPTCLTVCGLPCTVSNATVEISASCPHIEVRTWSATMYGVALTDIVQTITTDDITPPVVTVGADLDCYCEESCVPSATAEDNCDGTIATAAPVNLGNSSYQHCATDACGNPKCEVQGVIVNPPTPPTIVPVTDQTYECEDAAYTAPTASDDCDLDSSISVTETEDVTIGQTCGTDNVIKTIVRTFTATNSFGQTDSTTQTITIEDNNPPVLAGYPSSTEFRECTEPSWTVTATDVCTGVPSVEMTRKSVTSDGPYDYSYELVWSSTDDCGLTESFTTTVTIGDNTDPQFVGTLPQDSQVFCYEDIPDAATVTASDNCGLVTVSVTSSQDGEDCDQHNVTYTWTATDTNGNTISHSQLIEKATQVAPVCTSTPPQALSCEDEYAEHQVTCYDPCTYNTYEQDYASVSVTSSDNITTSNCGEIGTRIITTATDACGLSTTVIENVRKDDTTPPTFTDIPADDTQHCDYVEPTAPGAYDNCGDATVTKGDATSTAIGCTTTVTLLYTATDTCGLTTPVTHTQIVEDREAPVLVGVPADETVDCSANPPVPNVTATDDCTDSMTPVYSDQTFSVGTSVVFYDIRTWFVVDECGQTDTQHQTITYEDTTPPTLHGDFEDEVYDCVAPEEVTATATDDCSLVTTVVTCTDSAACGNTYQRICEITATDAAGMESVEIKTIDVIDATTPVLTFSGTAVEDATIECEDSYTPPVCAASDSCSSTSCELTTDNIGTEILPVIVYSWSATDECGNGASQALTVTTIDPTPPFFTAVPDQNYDCADTVHDGPTLVANDTCHLVSVDKTWEDSSSCTNQLTRVFTWTVTDIGGNTVTETATHTYTDGTPPEVSSDTEDATVECDAVPNDPVFSSADDCTATGDLNETSTSVVTDGSCSDEWTKTWTYTSTDDCGNTNGMNVEFVVYDASAPSTTSTPSDETISAADIFPVLTPPTWTDNCDYSPDISFAYEAASDDGGCSTLHTRTWTAVDNCGNTQSHTQSITVTEDLPPIITPPADITVECDVTDKVGQLQDASAESRAGAFLTVTSSSTVEQISACACNKRIIVTYSTVDDCGLTDTAAATVTVEDTTKPVFLCEPEDATYECDRDVQREDIQGTDVSFAAPQNATVTEISVGTAGCNVDYIRTYRLQDCSGTVNTHVQTITVIDDSAPMFVREPNDLTIECGCDTLPAQATIKAVDNCDDEVNVTPGESGDSAAVGEVERTWSAVDVCGNPASISQTLTIRDTTAPVLSGCPENETIDCQAAGAPVHAVGARDDCDMSIDDSSVELTEETLAGACYGEYTIVRTWSVTDAAGNEASKTQTVSVVDNEAPVHVAAADVATCLAPNAKVYQVDTALMFQAFDNCGNSDDAAGEAVLTMNSCNGTVVDAYEASEAFPPSSCSVADDPDGSQYLYVLAAPGRSYTVYATLSDDCGNEVGVSHTIDIPATMQEASVAGCTLSDVETFPEYDIDYKR